MSILGENGFYTAQMHIGILPAGTVTHIDRELKHGKSVAHEFFAKLGSGMTLLLGVGREVEEY